VATSLSTIGQFPQDKAHTGRLSAYYKAVCIPDDLPPHARLWRLKQALAGAILTSTTTRAEPERLPYIQMSVSIGGVRGFVMVEDGRVLRIMVFALMVAWPMVSQAVPLTFAQTFDDPTVTTGDRFGSVAIDGSYVLVGAPNDDTNGANTGQVNLFDLSGNLLQTFDDPTPTPLGSLGDNIGKGFGVSVAIDGDNVLIGAANDGAGANVGQAYLFDAITGNLLQTFDDPTPIANVFGDKFGFSVAIEGNNVLIGAHADGTNGLNVGQAHLFDLSGNLLQTFDDPTITVEDQFGYSVAIDGNNLLIGARGDRTNLATEELGQAHLFDALTGSLLQTFDDPTITFGDHFGASVAIDGNNVLIGARLDDTNGTNAGQAHLFDLSGNLLETFDDPTVTTGNAFGSSVAIDGNIVLIGDIFDDTNGLNVGQAHLFDLSGNLLQTFDDPTITNRDNFGGSVAIDGDNVLIGAFFDDTNGLKVGQAHLFSTPVVPIPAALPLFATGLGVLGVVGWRRRKAA
jgi:hypothetical protein